MALKRPLGGHLGISGVIFGQNSGEGCYWHLLSRDQHEHVLSRFSHVRLFATPWTVARQAPLSNMVLNAECSYLILLTAHKRGTIITHIVQKKVFPNLPGVRITWKQC